jgi:hypothetical protein
MSVTIRTNDGSLTVNAPASILDSISVEVGEYTDFSVTIPEPTSAPIATPSAPTTEPVSTSTRGTIRSEPQHNYIPDGADRTDRYDWPGQDLTDYRSKPYYGPFEVEVRSTAWSDDTVYLKEFAKFGDARIAYELLVDLFESDKLLLKGDDDLQDIIIRGFDSDGDHILIVENDSASADSYETFKSEQVDDDDDDDDDD